MHWKKQAAAGTAARSPEALPISVVSFIFLLFSQTVNNHFSIYIQYNSSEVNLQQKTHRIF
jgi:hypothetical protein